MIKLLIGGSPCTQWSIAQKNGRETEPKGVGWELFKNYLIAKEKFKPDFFLYENNKSAAQPIKDQISKELGVDLMHINSALVSAQNRQRFYAFNWEVEQPEDRGIVLRDILESGVVDREKSYDCPICHTIPQEVRVRKYTCDISKFQTLLRESKKELKLTNKHIAEELDRPQTEVEHWFRTDKYFNIPDESVWFDLKTMLGIRTTEFDDFVTVFEVREGVFEKADRCYDVNGKMSTLMTGKTDNIIMPIENVGESETVQKAIPKLVDKYGYLPEQFNAYNVAEITEKSPTLSTGSMVTSSCATTKFEEVDEPIWMDWDKKKRPIYRVENGLITIKGKQYPIKLQDGYYIIRKLTPVECERLQTLPDGYTKAVSNAQRYKGLGNGWTAEVIIHILSGVLKDVPRDEEIVVLSMYDVIGTGRYCLDKMGFTNVKYFAYEIDKFAKQVAMSNYPDIIQCGDAFDLRHPDWTIGY